MKYTTNYYNYVKDISSLFIFIGVFMLLIIFLIDFYYFILSNR